MILRQIQQWPNGQQRLLLIDLRADDRVAATGIVDLDPDSDSCEIHHLYVAPRWRQEGIATDMLRELEAAATRKRCHNITATLPAYARRFTGQWLESNGYRHNNRKYIKRLSTEP